MRVNQLLFISAAAAVALGSCSGKLGELSADNFKVTPNPLEAVAGQVPVTISATFPEKYMAKKAVVTVVPELRAVGSDAVAQSGPYTFQGEKVKDNNQVVQYKVGGNYTMKGNWAYDPAFHRCDLWLTFQARIGNREVEVPALKLAPGIIATSELYKAAAATSGSYEPNAYQRINQQQQEAVVKFLINQANLRKDEMKNNTVTEFVDMLKKLNADREGLSMKDIEVLAYASPDGKYDYNDKLAAKRQETAAKYVAQQQKAAGTNGDVVAKYTAEDWDGFQELVAASNLQDKDVILRVLSMYKDPQEREEQIRNMSAAFRELADGILPELRRSRMIINYETIGRDDAQIRQQFNDDASKLSLEELLRGADESKTLAEKEAFYKKAAEMYPDDARAYANLAAIEMAKGNDSAAKNYADKALAKDPNNAAALANRGLLALKQGNVKDAEADLAKASAASNVKDALGLLEIAKGNYAQAENYLAGSNSNAAALAKLLNNNYAGAAETLAKANDKNGLTSYLNALVAARRGNSTDAQSYLNEATKAEPSLKQYAEGDLEFSK